MPYKQQIVSFEKHETTAAATKSFPNSMLMLFPSISFSFVILLANLRIFFQYYNYFFKTIFSFYGN
jgi:hypothetical protein